MELLAGIYDRLGTLIAIHGNLSSPLPPRPRPVVALDRVRSRNKWQKHYALRDRLLPKNRN